MSRFLEVGVHLFGQLEIVIVRKHFTRVVWFVVVGCDTVWPCRKW
jgi:hypothetical protein